MKNLYQLKKLIMKPFTVLAALCFSSSILSAQKITFSLPEKAPYSATGNYIIGKVKDNIIVCKYIIPSKKFEVLLYDYNMKLKSRIPFDAFAKNDIYKIDFINHNNYFDAVVQYYSKKIFYCKVARFNENGQLLKNVETLDSQSVSGDDRNEVYGLLQSENKKEICLFSALTGVKENCLQLNYFMLNNDLTTGGRKKICVPFNTSFTTISPVSIDDEGSLVFAEYNRKGFTGPSNTLGVFKIEKNSELLLNTQHEMAGNEIADININIDNKHAQYFISGLFDNFKDENSIAPTNGIFTCVLNADLTEKAEDNFNTLAKIPGLENATTHNNESFSLSNISNVYESGYTLLYSADNIAHVNEDYSAPVPAPALNTDQNPFYKPTNYDYQQVQLSSLGVPTTPLYYTNQSHTNTVANNSGTNLLPQTKSSLSAQAGIKKLFLMHVNNKNQVTWSLNLNSNLDKANGSLANLYQYVNTASDLHFLFPQIVDDEITRLSGITINAGGTVTTQQIISNDLNYHIQTAMGVQVDEHSIVFPCEAYGKLAFVKIEF